MKNGKSRQMLWLFRPGRIIVACLLSMILIPFMGTGKIAHAASLSIDTVAGTGTAGYSGDGGAATAAQLNNPYGLTVDSSGNLYIADASNNMIRKIDTSGAISTVAGMGTAGYAGDGGAAVAAQLNSPKRVALDSGGNLYIADSLNSRIRKVDPSGTISTVAGTGTAGYSGDGGAATAAKLGRASGVAVDGNGNLYIADYDNHRIRKVDAAGKISTVAGMGTSGYSGDEGAATAAKLNYPYSVAVDSVGNLYIADLRNNRIRKVDPSGIISTVAGTGTGGYSGDGGPATAAQISSPTDMTVDSGGNLYIADPSNVRIWKVDASGIIRTIAGTGTSGYSGDGGDPTAAQLYNASGVAVDNKGNLYIADTFNQRVRKMGLPYTLRFNSNGGSAVSSQAINYDSTATQPTVPTKTGYTFSGWYSDSGLTSAFDFSSAITSNMTLYAKWTANIYTLTFNSNSGSAVSSLTVNYDSKALQPISPTRAGYTFGGWYSDSGLTNAFDFRSNTVTGDTTLYAKWVRLSIDLVAGTGIFSYSGDGGAATAAEMSNPNGIAVDSSGNLYIADTWNNRIRKIVPSGTISTVAGTGVAGYSGDGSAATAAQLSMPNGVVIDSSGNLYIVDGGNSAIRKVDASGTISTVAGTGTGGYSGDGGPATAAELMFPQGSMAVSSDGSLYIADTFNYTIRKVDPSGTISTVAGTGEAGYSGDGGVATAARLNNPYSVAIDSSGNLYIADSANNRIRKVDPSGKISTVAGRDGFGYAGDGGLATGAQLYSPTSMAIDSSGNLYIADAWNSRIRRVDSSGTISTIAGTLLQGYSGDGGAATAARLFNARGVAVDSGGTLYIADTGNNRIRKLGLLYTLSFNSNGGSVVADKQVSNGNATTQPTAPTRTSYLFAGWYSDSGLTHAFDFNSAITGDTTLYAKWTISSYTVSFTSNGGSAVPSQTVDVNGTAVEPTAPTKTGYTFAGWYSDSDLTIAHDFNSTITGNTALYAKWTINSYTVSFAANYGSAVPSQAVTYNTNASEPAAPTRGGYTFGGWYSEMSATNAFDFNSAITEDTTLYAKWTIDRYTVSFISNGGSEVPSQTVTYSLSASKPDAPTKSGYTFGGWYSDSGLTRAYDFYGAVESDTTLYAKWTTISYTVSFTSNGGSAVTSQMVDANGTAAEPAAPTKTGYTFAGWYSDSDLTNAYNFSSTITGDTTLYAKWAAVPVTGVLLDKSELTLTLGGGTTALTATVLPSNATNKNVTWESSNTSAATVDSSGVVTPVAAGTATILVTTADGSKSATSTVTVNALTSAATPSIDTQPADQTVNVGGSATLTVSASGGAALSNQWYSNATNSASGGTPISGATGASYAAPTTVTGTTYYYVVVTNTDSSATGSQTATATSRAAKVTVNTASSSGSPVPTGLAAIAGNGQVALTWNGEPGTVTYNVYVGTASGTYSLTPIATVSGATYSYTATGLTNGMTYYFAVKAISVEGTGGYSNEVSAKPVAATPNASGNANLSGLALSSGTLSPVFAGGITSYTASVGNSVNSVRVTPSVADSSAVMTVNGTVVTSGQASSAIALNVGSNPITVSVTAQDGKTTQTYTVNVTRAVVINAGSGTPIQVTTEPVSITVPSGVTNAVVAVATTMVGTNLEATLPLVEVQATTALGNVDVSIPAGTTITAPADWDGTIKMPQVQSTSSVTVTGGNVSSVIEVGAADIPLTFDKAVRLLIPNQGGKLAGYVRNGVFTPITVTITMDTQTAADNEIAAGGEAVITVGSDLVIWTKHFTKFVSYTKITSTNTGSTGTSTGTTTTGVHGGAATNSATIAAANGGTATLNRVTIEVPAGAMASSFTITVDQVSDTSSLPADSALQRASEVYEIKKDKDGDFSKPVVITLPFDKRKIDFAKSTAGIYWLNEQTRKWVQLDGLKVDEAKGTVSGSVSHFTKFAVLTSDKAKTEKPGSQTNATDFSDIQRHWAEANIKQAVSGGIVSGYPDGTFMPDHTVTRAEFAVMLMNALKPQGDGAALTFTDKAKIGAWAQKSVAQAVYAGIITGYEDGTFRPDAEITRPEMAVMIAKALGQSVEAATATGFADDKGIPAWSKSAVAAMKKLGIIEGKSANEFAPTDKTTRAEAVTVLLKMLAQKGK